MTLLSATRARPTPDAVGVGGLPADAVGAGRLLPDDAATEQRAGLSDDAATEQRAGASSALQLGGALPGMDPGELAARAGLDHGPSPIQKDIARALFARARGQTESRRGFQARLGIFC